MTAPDPEPIGRDSRGILNPRELQKRVTLSRFAPPPSLAGLIDRFWAVEWDFAPGESFTQPVLTHPGANLSVSPETGRAVEARLYGVNRRLVTRTMSGQGWAVAAMTRPGGLGPFVDVAVATYNERSVPLGDATQIDGELLVETVAAGRDVTDRSARLATVLEEALDRADPARRAAALEVTAVSLQAETNRTLRRVDELARVAGVGVRTLQRMFREHAGVSPTWVLRRYRLLDAAEAVRDGHPVSWVEVAADLGYADQAHLIRDFRAGIGRTPARYAAEVADSGHPQGQTDVVRR